MRTVHFYFCSTQFFDYYKNKVFYKLTKTRFKGNNTKNNSCFYTFIQKSISINKQKNIFKITNKQIKNNENMKFLY